MPPFSRLAAVILAAGESTRMGTDKALLSVPSAVAPKSESETFLSSAIKVFSESCCEVVVVAGKNAAALFPVCKANGAVLVVNPDPSRGQFSSLQIGLQEILKRGSDAAFITLVDRPPPKAATILSLRNACEAADASVWAVVPEYRGEHGHPYIASRSLIDAFLEAPAISSAREVRRSNAAHIVYVALDDPRVVSNINTPEEYSKMLLSDS
jgi:molybdenum cofactor cytidylyltransferase